MAMDVVKGTSAVAYVGAAAASAGAVRYRNGVERHHMQGAYAGPTRVPV